jgi:hypothetical protein
LKSGRLKENTITVNTTKKGGHNMTIYIFNFIGDLHGRTCWKDLIREGAINIFMGDYLDARESEYFDTQETNFLELLQYKKEHPDTVKLLLANHDLPYLYLGRYNDKAIDQKSLYRHSLFVENLALFEGVAYGCGNYIATHAGISALWYNRYFGDYQGESAEIIAQKLNQLLWDNLDAYRFGPNSSISFDYYGNDRFQSPVWIRPTALTEYNLLAGTDIIQIVGHSPMPAIRKYKDGEIVFIDCLGQKQDSYVVDLRKDAINKVIDTLF